MFTSILGGRVVALYEKVWTFIWWVHYRCFLVNDSDWHIGGDYSWCFDGFCGGLLPGVGACRETLRGVAGSRVTIRTGAV